MIRIGEILDRYVIEKMLGQGGMAAVYLARHSTLDSMHAIKVLFITAPDVRQRLMREGRVQANLKHPNILAVSDILEYRGTPALVMEYVEGPPMDAWLKENRPTLQQSLFLFRGILRGVMTAHDRGVIHRDLKPANVLLAPTSEGVVPKVADFGLTKSLDPSPGSTRTGMSMGTPEYMAPEQIRDSSDVDQRVDIFALGCILYELVTGKRAFAGSDNMAVFNSIVEGSYTDPLELEPDLPAAVVEVIRDCLQPDRDQRLNQASLIFDRLFENEDSIALQMGTSSGAPIRISGSLSVSTDVATAESQVSTVPPQAGIGTARTQPSVEEGRAFPPLESLTPSDTPPSPEPTTQAAAPPNGSLGRWALAFIPVALLSLALGYALAPRLLGTPQAAAPSLPQPITPSPQIAVEPGDATEQPAPEPVEPQPAIQPSTGSTEPVPAPVPVRVQPDPGTAEPEVQEVPQPQNATAVTVSVQGNASAAWLIGDSGERAALPASVSPGTYKIEADFGAGPVGAGNVTVREGSPLTLNCDAFFNQCRTL